jgi:hypothetical protein
MKKLGAGKIHAIYILKFISEPSILLLGIYNNNNS